MIFGQIKNYCETELSFWNDTNETVYSEFCSDQKNYSIATEFRVFGQNKNSELGRWVRIGGCD